MKTFSFVSCLLSLVHIYSNGLTTKQRYLRKTNLQMGTKFTYQLCIPLTRQRITQLLRKCLKPERNVKVQQQPARGIAIIVIDKRLARIIRAHERGWLWNAIRGCFASLPHTYTHLYSTWRFSIVQTRYLLFFAYVLLCVYTSISRLLWFCLLRAFLPRACEPLFSPGMTSWGASEAVCCSLRVEFRWNFISEFLSNGRFVGIEFQFSHSDPTVFCDYVVYSN